MPTLLIALASALLLAYLVTETISRFWSDSYLALLIVTFAALLINGLFNARLKQQPRAAQANNRQPQRDTAPDRGGSKPQRNRPQRNNRSTQDKRTNQGKTSPRQGAPDRTNSAKGSSDDKATRGPQEEGTVKWFNRSKGYGFIIRDNGDEIFVHQRSILTQDEHNQRPVLHDGQKVRFVVAHLEKGAQAEQVSGLD